MKERSDLYYKYGGSRQVKRIEEMVANAAKEGSGRNVKK